GRSVKKGGARQAKRPAPRGRPAVKTENRVLKSEAVGVAGVAAIVGLILLGLIVRALRRGGRVGDERQRNAGENERGNGLGEHKCLRWCSGSRLIPPSMTRPCRIRAKTYVKTLTCR